MLLPLADAQRTWKARHTANVEAKLADARRTLGIARRYYDELEALGGRLLGERMDAGEFERFLARLAPLPEPRPDRSDGGRAVRNVERVREAIRTAYRAAPDLENVRGTRWCTFRCPIPVLLGAARQPNLRTPHDHADRPRVNQREQLLGHLAT